MRIPRPLQALVVAAALSVAPGCSRGSPAPDSTGNARADDGGGRDACNLLTAEEVGALFEGEVLTPRGEAIPGGSRCEWFGSDGMFRFALEVGWRGGREAMDILEMAYPRGARLASQGEKEVEEMLLPGRVEGLGDAALFSPLLDSAVLRGDTIVILRMALVRQPERYFRPLAEKVLSRL